VGLSFLTDAAAVVVMDASTAINLNATGHAAAILRALPNRTVVTEVVLNELEGGRRTGRQDADLTAALVQAGLAAVVELNAAQEDYFEALVAGDAAETLDDGEAATIAYSVDTGAVALIDDRKATRICAARYPQVRVGCTVDIFAHDAVQAALGPTLGDAVVAALQRARMRVLPRHIDWVVDLIGRERAIQCPSLPAAVRNRLSLRSPR
jgi:predicted nucleic acid-binding protein